MTRRPLIIAVGAVALLLSIPLALLGRAALATPAAVARETAMLPADVRVGTPHRSLADRAAWHLLGAGHAGPFPEIVGIYREVTGLPAMSAQPTWSIRVASLIPRLRSPQERAQAYVMAGTLLALGAGDGLGVSQIGNSPAAKALLAQAADDFRVAIAADGGNEQAKYDLELLVRQQAPARPRTGHASRKPTTKPPPARGTRQKKVPQTQSQINDAGVYATGSGY